MEFGPILEIQAKARLQELRMERERTRSVKRGAGESPIRAALGGGMIRLGSWIAGRGGAN